MLDAANYTNFPYVELILYRIWFSGKYLDSSKLKFVIQFSKGLLSSHLK